MLRLILVATCGIAVSAIGCTANQKLDPDNVMISDGDRAWSLKQIQAVANDYVRRKGLGSQLRGSERIFWIQRDDSKVLARIWYSRELGEPSVALEIDRAVRASHRTLISVDRVVWKEAGDTVASDERDTEDQ